jgi:hypothetical protein
VRIAFGAHTPDEIVSILFLKNSHQSDVMKALTTSVGAAICNRTLECTSNDGKTKD